MNYQVFQEKPGFPVKAWVNGVPFEEQAKEQVLNVAKLPFIHKWVAIMPDVHLGKGATVGSVIPTIDAIIPAAVGVDIGCGMMAVKTSLNASQLPDNLYALRIAIEKAVPHGRTNNGGRGDRGAWGSIPTSTAKAWDTLDADFNKITEKHPRIKKSNNIGHLGTLGTGNHFIEVCLDEHDQVWVMLHSGSRGVGNNIGTHFIQLAKKEMQRWFLNVPDKDLAYLPEGSEYFDDYVEAVDWAQRFAMTNRQMVMSAVLSAMRLEIPIEFSAELEAVNCHHNYVSREHHFGKDVWLTRKGAVSAKKGELGIIPGSMGAKSYIVRGLGNKDSFCSCSHGAGRVMSRTKAKKTISLAEHLEATKDVECRKDQDVIDETPAAYKSIDAVIEAQKDLVEVVYILKQVVCVKG